MTPDSLLLADAVRVPLSSHGNSGSDAPVLLGIGFLIGIAFMYLGAKKWRVGRLIKNTPTERVRSVAVGRTEVNGTCRDAGVTYEQPYTDGECVYRHWEVEEYRESSDPDDNSSEWVTVDSGTDVAPFFLEDDTGQILVDTTEGPYFEVSDENSYSTKVGAGAEPPPEVQSFNSGSGSFLGIDEDTDPAEAMDKIPGMGKLQGVMGGDDMKQMMQGSQGEMGQGATTGEDGQSPEEMQRQFVQEHFDDEVLDENGQLREDVGEQELAEAMDDDMQGMGAAGFMSGMVPGGEGDDSDGDDGDGVADGTQQSDENTESASVASSEEHGEQVDVVQELGGTGTTGSMGTGSSLSTKLVNAGLNAATGGRFGSSLGGGGGLLGSSGSASSYNRRRFSHEVLPVDEEVYVFGEATPRKGASGSNAARLKIDEEAATGQFVVSDRSEEGIVKRYSRRGPLYVLLGLVISAACLGGLLIVLGVA